MKRGIGARIGDVAFLLPALFLSFLVAYPIYGTPYYLLVITVGLLIGAGLAWFSASARFPVWKSVAIAIGAYVVVGVPLAAPEVFWEPKTLLKQVVGVLLAPVAGPRQILSLEIPLGTYHQVLAPFFFLAIFVSLAVFSLSWRTVRAWPWAAGVSLIPFLAGIALGPRTLRSFSTYLPGLFSRVSPDATGSHAFLGAAVVLLLFGWLFWRPWQSGRATVRLSEGARGRWVAVRTARTVLGTLMVAAAVAGAIFVTPWAAESHQRKTLRNDQHAELLDATEVSPLSMYRTYFSNDLFGKTLFVVSDYDPEGRIRLATLDAYNGHVFGVVAPTEGSLGQIFAPVPAPIDPVGADDPASLSTIEIGAYRGSWVPLPGRLGFAEFEGEQKAELQDGFFYARSTGTAVQVAPLGLAEGVRYSASTFQMLEPTSAVNSFEPEGQGVTLVTELPDSIAKWIADQEQPRTGSGLLELISRLRERGFLSHSLSATEGDQPWEWKQALAGYSFESSRGGHSLDRIDRMFTRMNEQAEAAGKDASAAELVSAPGDDEQFAVAAALVADSLGFNTRIAVGARLGASGDTDLSSCSAGTCKGGDMAAWIEVQDARTGLWAPIDVTPQHKMPMSPRIQRTSDPKYATEVAPKGVEVLPPPQAKPSGGDAQGEGAEDSSSAASEAPFWVRLASVVGLSLLALAIPPITILGMKALRSARRKHAPDGSQQIVGAWDDYRDRADDYGYVVAPASTRSEVARELSFEDGSAPRLAELADYVSFQVPNPVDYDSSEAWELAGLAKANLAEGVGSGRRLRARLSLRSLFARARK